MSPNDAQTGPHRRRTLIGTLLTLLIGPTVWALHLTLIYAAHTLSCARGMFAGFGIGTLIGIVTGVALAVLIAATVWPYAVRRIGSVRADATRSFEDGVMVLLALLSAIGVTWAGATVLTVAPCPY